jgi:hypothetical protein
MPPCCEVVAHCQTTKKARKACAGRRRAQISMAIINEFKSVLVLFFEACQKGRFYLIT